MPLVTHTTYECPNISLWPRKRRKRKKGKEYNTEKLESIFSSLYTGCYFQFFFFLDEKTVTQEDYVSYLNSHI